MSSAFSPIQRLSKVRTGQSQNQIRPEYMTVASLKAENKIILQESAFESAVRRLWNAATTGTAEEMISVFQEHSIPNLKLEPNTGQNALFKACVNGHVECAAILIGASPDPAVLCSLWSSINSQVLEESRIPITFAKALNLSENSSLVTSIQLASLRISDEGAVAIASTLPRLDSLTYLNLSDNAIGNRGAASIARQLFLNHSLKTLLLNDNKIGDLGMKVLRTSLRTNRTLVELNCSNNLVQDSALETTINRNYLIAAISAVELGQRYDIEAKARSVGQESLVTLFDLLSRKALSSLVSLTLSNNSIDDAAVGVIASHLHEASSLSTLDLTENYISDNGALVLAHGLTETKISVLLLGNNRIADPGGVALAKACAMCPDLKNLDLWNNQVADSCAETFAKVIAEMPFDTRGYPAGIRNLNLEANNITDSGAKPLKEASTMRTVTLELRGNPCSRKYFESHRRFRRKLGKLPEYCTAELMKLVLVGTGGTGAKSAISMQYLQNTFLDYYDPTIEDVFRKRTVIDGHPVQIEFTDTAGAEEYAAIRPTYMKSGYGFLLGYSIIDRHSFLAIREFHKEILKIKGVDDYPKVIVGNKCDLEEQRVVSTSEGLDLANELNCPFFETSAKTRYNVDEAIEALVRETWDFSKDCQGLGGGISFDAERELLHDKKRQNTFWDFFSVRRRTEKRPQLGKNNTESIINFSLENDAAKLFSNYINGFQSAQISVQKPNVLICGATGAGKSSLINKVFGQDLCPTGTGKPITQNFTLYAPEDKPIRIFDSKGAELGIKQAEEFEKQIEGFLKQIETKELGHQIHVIWYVVNAATNRWQKADQEYCASFARTTGGLIPVIILLNKADQADKAEMLKKEIENSKPKNVIAVIPTVAIEPKMINAIEECPQCGGEGVIRKKIFICDDHQHKTDLTPKSGLNEVVTQTVSLLPNSVKDCFLQSQVVEIAARKKRCRQIICEKMEKVAREKFFQSKIASQKLGEMLAALARVWGFRLDHSVSVLNQRINEDFHISTTFALSQLFRSRRVNPPLFGSIGCLWSFYLAKCSSSSLKAAHSNSTQEVLDISAALELAAKSFGLTPTIVGVLETMKSYALKSEVQEVFDIIDKIITENDEKQHTVELQDGPSQKELIRKEMQMQDLKLMINQLLEPPNPDIQMIESFFSSYPTKVPLLEPLDIFAVIIKMYPSTMSTPEDQAMKQKVFHLIHFWISNCFQDFAEPTMTSELENFATYLEKNGENEFSQVLKQDMVGLQNRLERTRSNTMFKTLDMPRKDNNVPYILRFHPRDISEGLMLLNCELVSPQLNHSNVLTVNSANTNNNNNNNNNNPHSPLQLSQELHTPRITTAMLISHPTLVSMATRSESVARWVANTIVQEPHSEHRLQLVTQFILIAQNSLEFGDFETVAAVTSGLTWPSVSRLTKTWELLKEDVSNQIWSRLSLWASQPAREMWVKGRERVSKNLACLPYLPSLVTFLAALLPEERHEAEIGTVWGIEKFYKDNAAQKEKYPALVVFLKDLASLYRKTEDECFQLSKALQATQPLLDETK